MTAEIGKGDGTTRDGSTEAQLPPIVSDAQMRKLKVVVIAMGAILLAGFALVIGRIVYLLNRPPVDSSAATSTTAATALPAEARLALPPGSVVKHLSLSGNRLAVHSESAAGAQISIIELATGRMVQRIEIAPAGR